MPPTFIKPIRFTSGGIFERDSRNPTVVKLSHNHAEKKNEILVGPPHPLIEALKDM